MPSPKAKSKSATNTVAAPVVTVAIPTLHAGEPLAACLRSLEAQTFRHFEVVVIDNSGKRMVESAGSRGRVIHNTHNAGFGAAINQAYRTSQTRYIATLNDDAQANPKWLEELVACAERRPKAGMIAPCVMLGQTGTLDSAGMLIAADGTSKQRGHGEPPSVYEKESDALLCSGSAALYRRAMLEEIGLFDETFFLYCEDTDLGLRGRWAGWECAYAPRAMVEHGYSQSAGKASPLKAYYVERNRLYCAVKNLPWGMVLASPFTAFLRYLWHAFALLEGHGKAAEFRESGHDTFLLPFLVFRAHVAMLWRLPRLLAERRRLKGLHKLSTAGFRVLLRNNWISLREVASQ
ncbi:MAG: glycosyltransferase family 2 protein [Bryobacteraceae bacterium]